MSDQNTTGNPEKNPEENLNMENQVFEDLPKLYSKRVIYIFSVLFSTIFGTVLLMSNLKSLGEKKARIQVLIFGIVFTIGLLITASTLKTSTDFTIPLNILGGVILNEYFWNSYIGKKKKFEKKSWHKPAIISLAVCIPFVLAAVYAIQNPA